VWGWGGFGHGHFVKFSISGCLDLADLLNALQMLGKQVTVEEVTALITSQWSSQIFLY
jgi:hypothetical protein